MKIKFSSTKNVTPDVDQGVRVPYAAAKRAFPKMRWYLILSLVLSPFVYLGGSALWGGNLVKAPGLVELAQAEVRAPISGRVATVRVAGGAAVKEGEVLLAFSTSGEVGQRQLLEAQIDSARGPSVAADARLTIAALADTMASAQQVVAQRLDRLKKIEFLVAQGAATEAEINLARAQWQESELAYRRSRADWVARREASGPQNDGDRRSVLLRLEKEQALLDQEQADRVIKAQQAGTVLSVAVRPGDFVEQGASLLTIREQGEPFVTVYLDPKYGSFAKVGAGVGVRYPDGFYLDTQIVAVEETARKLPPQLQGPFSTQHMALVVKVATLPGMAPQHRVHGLPVEVALGRVMPSWWPF